MKVKGCTIQMRKVWIFFFIIIINRTERIRHTFLIDTTLMRVDKDDKRCLKGFSRPLGPSYAMQRMHEKDTLDPLIAQPQRLHIFIFTCHKENWIFELFYASTQHLSRCWLVRPQIKPFTCGDALNILNREHRCKAWKITSESAYLHLLLGRIFISGRILPKLGILLW